MKGCSVVLLGCAVLSCAGDTGRPEEIALEPLATIGADDGTGRYASMPLASEQLSDGRYFVTEPWGPAPQLVRIHDDEGRFLRWLGREGDGPGEYRSPEFARRVGDSVYVFDDRARQVTSIAAGEDSGPQRPWQARPYTFLVLADGSFLLTTGREGERESIQHVTRDGRLLRSFGGDIPGEPPHLGRGTDGTVWAVNPSRPEIQQWTLDGQHGRSLALERDWFPLHEEWRGPSPTQPPHTRIAGAWADSAHGLWLVAMVADPDWASGLGGRAMVEGREHHAIVDWKSVFDGVIERIDLRTGEATTHQRFDEPFGRVNAPWVV